MMKKGLFILVIFMCFGLWAQENQDVKDIADISLEDLLNIEVVTAGRSSQSLSKAPATMLVITENQILARGYKDLKDVFRDLPGFDISENNAGEVRTLVTARGILNNNKLMVLRDGKKLNSPGGELLVYGNNMPLFNVRKIEIIYGPSSAMYGADAFSGVVNIISKTPVDYQGQHVEAEVSYGTSNTFDLSASIAHSFNEDISLVVSGRLFSSDGEDVMKNFSSRDIFRVPSVYDSLWGNQHDWQQPIRDNNLFARLQLGHLTIGFIREDTNEPNGPATDVTQNGFNYNFDDTYIWHQQANRLFLDHDLDKGAYSFHTSLTYADYRVTPDSGWIYSWGPQYKYAKTTSIKLEEQVNVSFSENTKLVSGIMIEQVSCFPKTNNLNAQFQGNQLLDYVQYPDHPGLPDEYRNKTVNFGVFDYQNIGLFSEITHSFSRKIQVNFGLRYDYNSDYGDVLNPRAGLIWDLSDKTNIKILYGKAYIAPSRYMAYEHWSAGGAFGFYPNPDLAPERLDSISFNIRQLLTPNFAVTLNTYYNMLKDLIGQSGYPWITNVNADEAVTYGCELMLDYTREKFSAFLYYAYLNAEMDDSTPISKVSDHKVNAGITWYLNKLSFSPRVRWVSDISKIPSYGFDESTSMDGHFVFDLSIRAVDIFKNVDLYLTGNNLFNAAYFAAAPYGEGPSGWVMDKAPQPGLSIVAGLRIRL